MMFINRKLRLTITASMLALTAAAPAAFAQPQDFDGIYRGSYTDPIGTPNVPSARYTEPATRDRLTALGAVPDTGVVYYYNPLPLQFVIPVQPPGLPNY